jgi:hypothetical protein
MRSRILTDLERRTMERYLKADGEKDYLARSLARYAKRDLEQLRKDLQLIEKFYRAYVKKNGDRK